MSNDREAIAELAAVSDVEAPHSILHYLYLPNRASADAVALELRQLGFATEQRLGADGQNWLVLARNTAVPSEVVMATTRRLLESFAATVGGEYDGWEAELSVVRKAGEEGDG